MNGATLTGIAVYFKLDPRLTRSLYMGERWVSPPTYTHASPSQGQAIVVEARAHGVDASGRLIDIRPEWKAGDAGMLQVLPAQGHQVKFTVLQEGETKLSISYGEFTKELTVTSMPAKDGVQVNISQ